MIHKKSLPTLPVGVNNTKNWLSSPIANPEFLRVAKQQESKVMKYPNVTNEFEDMMKPKTIEPNDEDKKNWRFN
jgi:hypothetical protein